MSPKELLVSVLLVLAAALVVRAKNPPAQGAITASYALSASWQPGFVLP